MTFGSPPRNVNERPLTGSGKLGIESQSQDRAQEHKRLGWVAALSVAGDSARLLSTQSERHNMPGDRLVLAIWAESGEENTNSVCFPC